jgi:hypothetical protein
MMGYAHCYHLHPQWSVAVSMFNSGELPRLRSLTLRGVMLDKQFFQALARAPQLERLNIAAICVAQVWQVRRLSYLFNDISTMDHDANMFTATIVFHPGLRHLQITGNIGEHLSLALVRIIRSSNLESLSVHTTAMQNFTKAEVLRGALKVSKLKKLEIMGWELNSFALSISGAIGFEELVLGSPTGVNQMQHDMQTHAVLQLLEHDLGECRQLRRLDIRNLTVGRDAYPAAQDAYATAQLELVKGLAALPHLQELGLRIGETLPDKLFEAVLTLPHLETLRLHAVNKSSIHSQIDSQVTFNCFISDLYGTAIQQLEKMIVRNASLNIATGRSLKRFCLSGCHLHPSNYPTFHNRADELDLWFQRLTAKCLPGMAVRLTLEWLMRTSQSLLVKGGEKLTLTTQNW